MTVHIIAECGVNWSSIEEACYMIDQSKEAGADYVKFQLFNKEIIQNSPLFDKLEPLILKEKDVELLQMKAKATGLGFILTPMYLEAVDVAAKYADYIKIRFKDNENIALINQANATDKIQLISVPHRPINCFEFNKRYLYCIPRYPPDPEDFNLEYATACDGFSSHFPYTIFDLAFAINRINSEVFIEKHVMYEKQHPIDEAVSISFKELKNLISQLRLIERMKRIRL